MTDQLVMDARVARRLRQAFWDRLRSDTYLILVGNLAAAAVVALTLRDHASATLLTTWTAAIVAMVSIRTAWQLRVTSTPTDRRGLRMTRILIAVHALCWGVGAAIALGNLPAQYDAVVLAVLAVLCGVGVHTLSADSTSFYLLLGGIVTPLPFGLFAGEPEPVWEMAVMVATFTVAMLIVHRSVRAALIEHLRTVIQLTTAEETQSRLVAELRAALASVKTLTGLLPICSSCRKVRDDMGYWSSVERYIADHTDARFSHGVCPDCFPKLFPGIPLPESEEQTATR